MYVGLQFGPALLVGLVMLWPRTAMIVIMVVCLIMVVAYLLWPTTSAIAAVISPAVGHVL